MSAERSVSGLWLPRGFSFTEHRKTVRTVVLPNGRKAKVWVDDSGTTMHQETDTGISAVVRPKPINIRVFPRGAK